MKVVGIPGNELAPRVVAGAALTVLALVTFDPGGAAGDLHRALVVALCGVLAGFVAWHRLVDATPPDGHPGPAWQRALPLVVLGLALAGGLLQLLPLPLGLVRALAPDTGALYERLDQALGVEPSWRPVSIEPLATWRALWLGAAYLLFFRGIQGVAHQRRLAEALALALALLGGLVSLVALSDLAEREVLDPWSGRPRTPFVNPNHLCTFLVAGLGAGLGAALRRSRDRLGGIADLVTGLRKGSVPRRGLALVAVALIALGIVLTQSRAGAMAGTSTVILALGLTGRLGGRGWGLSALAVGALAVGLVASDPDPLLERFERTGLDSLSGRVENWRVATAVAAGRPWAGSGLATFRDASLAVLDEARPGSNLPGEAHNDYLELASDLGFPLSASLVLGLLALIAVAIRRVTTCPAEARGVAGGCLAGALGVLVHELFDFGLQIPAVALAFLVVFALAWGCPPATPRPLHPARPHRRALPLILLALALVAVGSWTSAQAAAEARGERAFARITDSELRPALRAEQARRTAAVLGLATGSLARARVPYLRGQALWEARGRGWRPQALAALREAAAKAPARAEVHASLATLLLAGWTETGDPEALREGEARLALALELGPTLASVSFTAGWWELELQARTGRADRTARAIELLGAALRRDPRRKRELRRLLTARAAVWGAAGEAVARALLP